MDAERPFFATAAKGTEGALRDELKELGLPQVRADRGGVHFGGGFADAMRACFESRIALRVLWRRGSFDASSPDALYEGVRAIDLSDVLDPERTLAVSANVKSGQLTHSGFVAQKAKDAIVDGQRARFNVRSNVERSDPDVHVLVHVVKDRAELSLDLAGTSLHQRGYRGEAREAPIKETLAAAMLRLCGWDRTRPLVDPMCGSGTIAIEAALWARDVAPGLLRKSWGFQRWLAHDDAQRKLLNQLREAARERAHGSAVEPTIMALDVDREAARLARKLAQRAGVAVHVQELDVREFAGTDPPGQVLTNPPYGVRLERGEDFDRSLARTLRALKGHRVSAICFDPGLRDAMRMAPVQEHTLWNGDLECRLFTWEP
jgi:23S rRNA (guanine2445-N2)-methyltransferase / 23S rRNA (guanine2069-N7)-methyltransferase